MLPGTRNVWCYFVTELAEDIVRGASSYLLTEILGKSNPWKIAASAFIICLIWKYQTVAFFVIFGKIATAEYLFWETQNVNFTQAQHVISSQQTFACSKSVIEILEKSVKYD